MRNFISLLMLSLLVAGPVCAGEQTHPVIKAVRVVPLQFNAATGLTVEPVLHDNTADYSFEYRWFLNGEELLTEISASLPGELLKRDDEVAVEVIPVNVEGEKLTPLFALPLKAVNVSPTIDSGLPETFGQKGFFYQVLASDLDGDSLTYQLENAPEGMRIDSANGLLSWVFETMPEGIFKPVIIVEDGYGGRAEQSFELNLSYVAKGSANNE